MKPYRHVGGTLYIEQVAVAELAAQYGTPLFVYSADAIEARWRQLDRAVDHPHLICYAVKANSNLAVLRLLSNLGSGFDVVSGGELARVIAAGGDPKKTVFSGVGKSAQEIRYALQQGVRCLNVESEQELARVNSIAGALGLRAPVAIRVNPDVDAVTHPYISTGLRENKFGLPFEQAISLCETAAVPHVDLQGITCHIGSQILELAPLLEAIERTLELVDRLTQTGIRLRHVDVGGGVGVAYSAERPPSLEEYGRAVTAALHGRPLELLLEPGRALSAEAGLLICQVEYLKAQGAKRFAVVNAGMNDLLRPALYDAYHEVLPVTPRRDVQAASWDIVGPLCESGDFLAKDRTFAIEPGDLLAVADAGAYGFAMSSNYNSRPRAAEVMVRGDSHWLIRARESFDQLIAGELQALD